MRHETIAAASLGRLSVRSGPSKFRIVALGGGTGLPTVLQGLRTLSWSPYGACKVSDRECLTAIVNVADDGGSSGRLRRAYGILPPGDLRNCLLALSDGAPSLSALFNFRFNGNGDISGHNLGNLILTALHSLQGDFLWAIDHAGELLNIRGRVLPALLTPSTLMAEYEDGLQVSGESAIASGRSRIARVWLRPSDALALPQAVEAIHAADVIVIGPGSLYTSLLPILLVPGIREALAACQAHIVLIMNLMTEWGETEGYTAADMVQAIQRHAPKVRIQHILLNDRPFPGPLLSRYAEYNATPVSSVPELLAALGTRPVQRDLLAEEDDLIRHDPCKVGRAILELAKEVTIDA